MKNRIGMVSLIPYLILGVCINVNASPISKDMAAEVASYVATMVIAGRGVVAKHQDLINDPSRGEKGFTPEYVEKEMLRNFKKMTGKDIKDLDPYVQKALQEVLSAAKMSVKNNQPLINQKGKGFKKYIPAVFGREIGQILRARNAITIKQTTFKYRNPYNQPDSFEKKVLRMFEDPGYPMGKGYGSIEQGKFRYLKPIYIRRPCLQCHGEPKGAIDISGHKKEGYKLGQLRGAISVSFPVQ